MVVVDGNLLGKLCYVDTTPWSFFGTPQAVNPQIGFYATIRGFTEIESHIWALVESENGIFSYQAMTRLKVISNKNIKPTE